jgi:ABC-type transport system involved in Fe-S cluster assembly fused permease/ATPase subunit
MAAPLSPLSPELVMTTTTETSLVNVNDQLVEFANLLNALRYLYEEIQTAKPDTTSMDKAVEEYFKSDPFSKRMTTYLKRYQIPAMTEMVSTDIKNSLDSQLENYILAKLDDRIEHVLRTRLGRS